MLVSDSNMASSIHICKIDYNFTGILNEYSTIICRLFVLDCKLETILL